MGRQATCMLQSGHILTICPAPELWVIFPSAFPQSTRTTITGTVHSSGPVTAWPPQRLTLTLAHPGAPAISYSYWLRRHALCASEGSRLSFDLTSLINLGRVIELLICSYFGCYRIKMCKVGRLKGVTSTHNFRNRRTTSSPAWGWQSREGMLKEETLGHGAEQPLRTLPSLCPVDSSQMLRLRLGSGHHDTVCLFRHPDPRNLLRDSREG